MKNKIRFLLLSFTFLLSCSSDELQIDPSQLLKDFVEPIPEFGIDQAAYQNLYGIANETGLRDGTIQTITYNAKFQGEISREIQFWRSVGTNDYVFTYVYLLIHENRQNLEFLTDYFTAKYGSYALIESPDSRTETRRWLLNGAMIIDLNCNFQDTTPGNNYLWGTYKNIEL
jgi:hypothetical protein